MSAKLEVRNATFSYDGIKNIFENISFSVECGEVFCILGQNGTGKSTLLRCLCNLNKLNEGKIRIDDLDISSMNSANRAKKIGFIPQIHIPTFPYTVFDVVLMGRTSHVTMMASPSENDCQIAEDAINILNLKHIRDIPYTQLSGGQMQLVLMARVLAQEPEILLLDEPTSHLDVGNQIHTIEMIKKLSKKGLSIIMTSHYPDHAFLSADKVGLMKNKKFLAQGNVDDVVTEQNLVDTYGIDMKIVYLEEGINRKITVPLLKKIF